MKAGHHFAKYEDAVKRAEKELEKSLIPLIQELLAVAMDSGDFYVCTGMGLCSLSANKFKVIYKDDPDIGVQDDTDDFDLAQKLKEDGPYGVVVQCSTRAREALLEIAAICERLTDKDLHQVLPYKIYKDRIEK